MGKLPFIPCPFFFLKDMAPEFLWVAGTNEPGANSGDLGRKRPVFRVERTDSRNVGAYPFPGNYVPTYEILARYKSTEELSFFNVQTVAKVIEKVKDST